MSLENLNHENEIINIYNRFRQKKSEYNKIDEKHKTEKDTLQAELAKEINLLKDHHCYNDMATDVEKSEMNALLENLVPIGVETLKIGGVDVL